MPRNGFWSTLDNFLERTVGSSRWVVYHRCSYCLLFGLLVSVPQTSRIGFSVKGIWPMAHCISDPTKVSSCLATAGHFHIFFKAWSCDTHSLVEHEEIYGFIRVNLRLDWYSVQRMSTSTRTQYTSSAFQKLNLVWLAASDLLARPYRPAMCWRLLGFRMLTL